MIFVVEYWLVGVVAAVVAVTVWIYRKGTETFDFWRSRGVPYVPGVPFLGSVPRMILQTSARSEELRRLYDALDGHPFRRVLHVEETGATAEGPGDHQEGAG
ncbi:hypothetical protein PR048_031246 [Dryococelus australis]|uniref:Cytochrome P450 n=1 Tax=Dryococelus australis TaxID=614101 RepID=A0ABQ9G4P9_9NEOP|nr:hypothetical protein PR048_031246 [Dryococelus australis]